MSTHLSNIEAVRTPLTDSFTSLYTDTLVPIYDLTRAKTSQLVLLIETHAADVISHSVCGGVVAWGVSACLTPDHVIHAALYGAIGGAVSSISKICDTAHYNRQIERDSEERYLNGELRDISLTE